MGKLGQSWNIAKQGTFHMKRRHLSGLGTSVPTGKGDLWGLGMLDGRNSGPGNGIPAYFNPYCSIHIFDKLNELTLKLQGKGVL